MFVVVFFAGSNADWTCSDTKCYKYFEDPLIWEDAEKRCVDRNGNLATIQNTAENSMVTLLLQRNAWIGLNDLLEAGMSFSNFSI